MKEVKTLALTFGPRLQGRLAARRQVGLDVLMDNCKWTLLVGTDHLQGILIVEPPNNRDIELGPCSHSIRGVHSLEVKNVLAL